MPASPRTLASVWAAKTAVFASRSLKRGGGTAVGGLVGLKLQPGIISDLAAQLGHGSVLVTGTNGKTTTSRLIVDMATAAGLLPLANASGSNLMRGIASALALEADASGRLSRASERLGVLEVDEATVPLVLPQLKPRVAVFNNLFRDQLDRYGEVEAVSALWREALSKAPRDLTLVLNADDPTVASLGEGRDNVLYFGVDDRSLDRASLDHAADALSCTCGARLVFEAVYFGHMGRWRCPACGRERPTPAVSARKVDLQDGHTLRLTLVTPTGEQDVSMGIGGLYNAYNALAASAAAVALGLPESCLAALSGSSAAFGRQESFDIDGRRVEMLLAKNPAGLNQVLSTVMLDEARRNTALIVLNDGVADGRDISWVWDADFEVAATCFATTVVGGTRAEEMALRLKYAEWPEESLRVEPDLTRALDAALAATAPGECLSVLPTYTAMLSLRELLARRDGRAAFWRQ